MRTEKPEDLAFYTQVLIHLIWDTARHLSLSRKHVERDVKTLLHRCDTEGLEFVTKTLPKLGKAFDKSLSTDTPIEPIPEFKFRLFGNKKLPVFLGGLFKMVYDVNGKVRDREPDGWYRCYYEGDALKYEWSNYRQVTAVRAIRQIAYLGYKLEYPYDKSVEKARLDSFVSLDESLPHEREHFDIPFATKVAIENANLLLGKLFVGLKPHEILPKHGPGSVATGEVGPRKYAFSRYFARLGEVFDYSDNFFYNYNHLGEELESLEQMTYEVTACAKVALVPKDSRGPRIISMEPLEIQWIQQGLASKMIQRIEHPDSMTYGYVNFTSQDVNRGLAMKHSLDGDFVTLDLSDASDRVSIWLVSRIFPRDLGRCLEACRSTHTKLPDGRTIALKKFATMGSACCFPVEALVFWALAVGSLVHIASSRDFKSLPPVYVYGDDIVIRRSDYEVVRDVYQSVLLRLNDSKCCTGKFFRESCGCDAFKGEDVTPVRFHSPITNRLSPKALAAYVAYTNAFASDMRGYSQTAHFMSKEICKRTSWALPFGDSGCEYPLAFDHSIAVSYAFTKGEGYTEPMTRFNSKLDRDEVFLPFPHVPSYDYSDRLGWANLWLSKPKGNDPFGFENQSSAGVFPDPHRVRLRGRWVDIGCLHA